MGSRYKGNTEEVRALNAFIKLKRAADSVSARLLGSLSDIGLTESQFGVLEALYHLGPMHQCDLGHKLLSSSGNVTMVVDNLEKRGLVRREREKDDRRFISVNLTAQGRHLIQKVMPGHVEAIVKQMKPLTAVEQDRLGELCKKLGRAEAR